MTKVENKSAERHLVVRFRCPAENTDKVKLLLNEFVGPARNEEGCLYYDLYQCAEDPTVFYILDGWSNEAAVAGHVESANVKRVVGLLLPLLCEPPNIVTNTRVSDPT